MYFIQITNDHGRSICSNRSGFNANKSARDDGETKNCHRSIMSKERRVRNGSTSAASISPKTSLPLRVGPQPKVEVPGGDWVPSLANNQGLECARLGPEGTNRP